MWDKVPTFSRFICVTTITIYLSSFLTMIVPAFMVAIPYNILYQLQIWRVFTGALVHIQLLQLLFSLLSYVPTAIG
jgi:membrane associated rhomboid family serine protease